MTAFKSGYELYDLQSARNVNGATNIKDGPCSLLSNQIKGMITAAAAAAKS